jgi:hypothetical protein
MGKMKDLSLKFIGYEVTGIAHLNLWGGGEGTIRMSSCFIHKDELSPSRIKTCVNDNGFGCEKITSAKLDIYKIYGEPPYYKQFDRTIELNEEQCFDGIRGIFTQ